MNPFLLTPEVKGCNNDDGNEQQQGHCRTAAKVNESVEAFNTLETETGNHLQKQDKEIETRLSNQDKEISRRMDNQDTFITTMNNETMPAKVSSEVQKRIDDGSFDSSINEYMGNLNERVENLVSHVPEGGTTSDAELIDIRLRFNGETETSAGAAVRAIDKEVEQVRRDLYVNFLPKRITFDENGVLKTNGYFDRGENNYNTGLIDIEGFSHLKYLTNIYGDVYYVVGFYDKERNLLPDISIKALHGFTEQYINLSTVNAKYVLISGYNNINNGLTKDKFYCELWGHRVNDDIEQLKTDTEQNFDGVFRTLTPLKFSFPYTGYIVGNNIIAETVNGYRTGLCRCDGFSTLEYKSLLDNDGQAVEVMFYDENKNPMREISIMGRGVFTVNKVDLSGLGATFCQISGYTNLDRGSSAETAYAMVYNYDVKKEVESLRVNADISTKDKKILIFGDSITQTASISDDGSTYTEGTSPNWPQHIPELLGTTNFRNYALWGAHFADFATNYPRQCLSNQINMAMSHSVNDDSEIIILSLGTNDGGQTAIDDYDTAMAINSLDGLDRTKLYQAIRWALWTLKTKYPNTIGFITTPLQRADREPMKEVSDAIRKMANRYNFIVIDAENESGIIRENEVWHSSGKFLKDGLHTNEAGSRKIAEFYCNIIRNYV